MIDDSDRLKPCPFCGGAAEMGCVRSESGEEPNEGGYFIACLACDASTGLRFACGDDPKPLLIEQWNRRTALAQQAEPKTNWCGETCERAKLCAVCARELAGGQAEPVTPPQRQPLTEEEILKAIGWERAEMYMKLTPNFPIEEARKETIKNARAIERAHGIKE